MVIFKNNSYRSKLKENPIFGKYFYDEFLKDNDNVGLVIRTTSCLYVSYVDRKKLEILPYSDFLADDYHRFVKIRYKDRIGENPNREEMSSLHFLKKLKESDNNFADSVDLLYDYFNEMKMCGEMNDESRLNIVDSPYPLCIEKRNNNYIYSRSLIVRTSDEKQK